jgi:organic radical activating enzyme
MSSKQASILEIFESRQGEGIRVGEMQVFIRFAGCGVRCDYCDTPESIPPDSVKTWALDDVVKQATSPGLPRVISLTGGEPLNQVDFLQKLIPALRAKGCRIYLETNGILPEALAKIVNDCDCIAMDFKPESAIGHDVWEAHRWFLEIGGGKLFVKMVLTDKTTWREFQKGVGLIACIRPEIPLVLQPATPQGGLGTIPLERLASWWISAARRLKDVRILPQVHRLWGIA